MMIALVKTLRSAERAEAGEQEKKANEEKCMSLYCGRGRGRGIFCGNGEEGGGGLIVVGAVIFRGMGRCNC